jgi:hypothetical protein
MLNNLAAEWMNASIVAIDVEWTGCPNVVYSNTV